ncbi:hypothetical protein ACSSS7_000746 [Eimeria intestinalis]
MSIFLEGLSLSIPGSDLRGVCTAQDIVFWFNRHPAHSSLHKTKLASAHSSKSALVVGHGNVALDVARLLLKSAAETPHTHPAAAATAAAPAPAPAPALAPAAAGSAHQPLTAARTPAARAAAIPQSPATAASRSATDTAAGAAAGSAAEAAAADAAAAHASDAKAASGIASAAPAAASAAAASAAAEAELAAAGGESDMRYPISLSRTDANKDACAWSRSKGFSFVRVIGRRGPAQASFTNKELRALLKEESFLVVVDPKEMDSTLTDASQIEIKWPRRHSVGLPVLQISFCLSPIRIVPSEEDPGSVGSVLMNRNLLEGPPGHQRAIPSDHQLEQQAASLVVWSLGFTIDPLERLANKPLSHADAADKALLPMGLPLLPLHAQGRGGPLVHTNGQVFPPQQTLPPPAPSPAAAGTGTAAGGGREQQQLGGLYVVGWFKHGPRGTIAAAVVDAQQTAQQIFKDLTLHQQQQQEQQEEQQQQQQQEEQQQQQQQDRQHQQQEHSGPLIGLALTPSPKNNNRVESLDAALRIRGVSFVTFEDWQKTSKTR